MQSQAPTPPATDAAMTVQGGEGVELSEAEKRARRTLIIIAIVVGVLLVGLIVLLVFLAIDAYQATFDPSALPSRSSVVVGVLRDAAIVFVAFQTLVIGVLLIILMAQIQSLVVLLREEIKPMLDALNETMATVRGTTQFVSHNVVSPVMRWSGYLAGLRRMARDISELVRTGSDRSS